MQEDRLIGEVDRAHGMAVWKRGEGGNRFLFQIRLTRRDGQVDYTGAVEIRAEQEQLVLGPSVEGSLGDEPKHGGPEHDEIVLPATISRAMLAGAGRHLIAHLGIQSQAIVVDLESRKPVLTVDAPADSLLAANLDTLLVVSPIENRLERWSLPDLAKSGGGGLMVPGQVRAMAMGHASTGPLLVFWADNRSGYFSIVDPQSMRSQLISNLDRTSVLGPRLRTVTEDINLRAAANGSAFGVWVSNRSPMGVELIFPGRQPLSVYQHTTLGYLAPTADGSGLCTSQGFLSIDLVRRRSTDPCLPGANHEYYLSISQRSIHICSAADGSVAQTFALTEKFFDGKGLTPGPLPIDQRFHLIPQLNLLVLVPPRAIG